MLKLWGRLNSSNVQKVVWACDELGLPVERTDAGMAFGVVNTPEYRAMNPNGLVPVIDDDGFVLWESNAILRYLATKAPSVGLMPADPKAAARADQWSDWVCGTFYPAFAPAFMGLIRTAPEKRDGAAIDASLAKSETLLGQIEGRFAEAPFVAGPAFSYGDIVVGVFVNRWVKMGLSTEKLPATRAWYERIAARPGAARVVAVPVT